jgi:hypothetical protein
MSKTQISPRVIGDVCVTALLPAVLKIVFAGSRRTARTRSDRVLVPRAPKLLARIGGEIGRSQAGRPANIRRPPPGIDLMHGVKRAGHRSPSTIDDLHAHAPGPHHAPGLETTMTSDPCGSGKWQLQCWKLAVVVLFGLVCLTSREGDQDLTRVWIVATC